MWGRMCPGRAGLLSNVSWFWQLLAWSSSVFGVCVVFVVTFVFVEPDFCHIGSTFYVTSTYFGVQVVWGLVPGRLGQGVKGTGGILIFVECIVVSSYWWSGRAGSNAWHIGSRLSRWSLILAACIMQCINVGLIELDCRRVYGLAH